MRTATASLYQMPRIISETPVVCAMCSYAEYGGNVLFYCFCCFTAQVPVSWKRLPWIQMRVQMQPSLVSRYGFYIIISK